MLDERECFERYDSLIIFHQPPWRNRLARSAVNRKVGGSSPPGGANPFGHFWGVNIYQQGQWDLLQKSVHICTQHFTDLESFQ